MPSSSCRPLKATSTFTSSSCPPGPTPLPHPPQVRRPRRVLYPACQSRRLPMREAPDQARRWLLLLSALVFLQIYTEETHTCTEHQSQCPDPAASQNQEGEENLGTAQGWTAEGSWRVQIVARPSESQLECVVS